MNFVSGTPPFVFVSCDRTMCIRSERWKVVLLSRHLGAYLFRELLNTLWALDELHLSGSRLSYDRSITEKTEGIKPIQTITRSSQILLTSQKRYKAFQLKVGSLSLVDGQRLFVVPTQTW